MYRGGFIHRAEFDPDNTESDSILDTGEGGGSGVHEEQADVPTISDEDASIEPVSLGVRGSRTTRVQRKSEMDALERQREKQRVKLGISPPVTKEKNTADAIERRMRIANHQKRMEKLAGYQDPDIVMTKVGSKKRSETLNSGKKAEVGGATQVTPEGIKRRKIDSEFSAASKSGKPASYKETYAGMEKDLLDELEHRVNIHYYGDREANWKKVSVAEQKATKLGDGPFTLYDRVRQHHHQGTVLINQDDPTEILIPTRSLLQKMLQPDTTEKIIRDDGTEEEIKPGTYEQMPYAAAEDITKQIFVTQRADQLPIRPTSEQIAAAQLKERDNYARLHVIDSQLHPETAEQFLKRQDRGKQVALKHSGNRGDDSRTSEQRKRARTAYQDANIYKGYQYYGDRNNKLRGQDRESKSDFGISPGKEKVVELSSWELVDPSKKNKEAKDTLHITLKNPAHAIDIPNIKNPDDVTKAAHARRKATGQAIAGGGDYPYSPSENQPFAKGEDRAYAMGESLRNVLSANGVNDVKIDVIDSGKDGYKYTVTSSEGSRINPARAAKVQEALAQIYSDSASDHDEPNGVIAFTREGPAMKQQVRVVKAGEKMPNLDPKDVTKITKRHVDSGVKFGEREVIRDPLTGQIQGYGDLKEGQSDQVRVPFKLPGQKQNQNMYLNLQERSDAMGWGTSWRPGEKEINQIALAYPRAKQKRALEEAALKAQNGDMGEIDKLIIDKYGRGDPTTLNEAEMKHYRKELVEIGSASMAAGVYSARKAVKSGPMPTWLRDKPGFKQLWDYGIWGNVNEAFVHPAGQKLERFLWRSQPKHWLRDPERLKTHPLEFGFMPDMPSVRYRTVLRGDTKGWRKPDVITHVTNERLKDESLDAARMLDKLSVALNKRSSMSKAERWARIHSAKGIKEKWNAPGQQNLREIWAQRVADEPTLAKKYKTEGWERDHGKNWIKHEKVLGESGGKMLGPSRDLKLVRKTGKAGMYGLGVLAVTGAGVYVYDKYHEGNQPQDKPRLRDNLPEQIKVPELSIKRSKEYQIPLTQTADFLDIAGEKIPIKWKVGIKTKNTRIRNFKDVSGDPYIKGAPLVGKLSTKTPENTGSWVDSLAYKTSRDNKYVDKRGPGENYQIKVKGKEIPAFVSIEKKDRWKKGDLSTKNPNKLTVEDREKIANAILHGNDSVLAIYGNDPKIMEMINDEDEKDRLRRKYDYLMAPQKANYMERQYKVVYDQNGVSHTEWLEDPYGDPLYKNRYDKDNPLSRDRWHMTAKQQKDEEQHALDVAEEARHKEQTVFTETGASKTLEDQAEENRQHMHNLQRQQDTKRRTT